MGGRVGGRERGREGGTEREAEIEGERSERGKGFAFGERRQLRRRERDRMGGRAMNRASCVCTGLGRSGQGAGVVAVGGAACAREATSSTERTVASRVISACRMPSSDTLCVCVCVCVCLHVRVRAHLANSKCQGKYLTLSLPPSLPHSLPLSCTHRNLESMMAMFCSPHSEQAPPHARVHTPTPTHPHTHTPDPHRHPHRRRGQTWRLGLVRCGRSTLPTAPFPSLV